MYKTPLSLFIKGAINIVLAFSLGLLIGLPVMLYTWATGKIGPHEASSYVIALFSPWQYAEPLRKGEKWFWEK